MRFASFGIAIGLSFVKFDNEGCEGNAEANMFFLILVWIYVIYGIKSILLMVFWLIWYMVYCMHKWCGSTYN